MRRRPMLIVALLVSALSSSAAAQERQSFTRADTLRGSNGPAREWWDASFYDLHVRVLPDSQAIRGHNTITYRVLKPSQTMQIDLQVPLEVDSIVQDGRTLEARRDGNAFFVTLVAPQRTGETKSIAVYYHGQPRAAENPPWDGGFIWRKDSLGNPWIATANEGLGASVWWPNKDYLADEPDSQRVAITVPDPMIDVSNGRLRSTVHHDDATTTYEWFVSNPINNYNVAVNAGSYAHFGDVYDGEGGRLTLDYWPLAIHLDTARVQFRQVKPMLACFEGWFGPYPWYKDGFKLVETPHLGMEHQSAVAYGNHYVNGYWRGGRATGARPGGGGVDLSGTGEGLDWDFIIVHESAHEWWGNNITMQDQADMWIHESFANYAENLYVECLRDTAAGERYVVGTRRAIRNDVPIVAPYGVNADGSGDMYYKGGNMLHAMRQVVDNDSLWRATLRGLNETFRHQTVTGAQVQRYINETTGIDFSKVFEQYLTTTDVPVLEYRNAGSGLEFRWTNVVPGFDMPVRVTVAPGRYDWIHPTTEWQTSRIALPQGSAFSVDPGFYVTAQRVE
jgi:aminopeptidase N